MDTASIDQLLSPLRDSINNKPPLASGTLQLPTFQLSLFYKFAREGHDARYIDFANTTFSQLEQLVQACEPASFGLNDKDVLDENYRKAGKMDSELFSTPLVPEYTDLVKILRGHLLEGTDSTRKLKIELYKLNVYGQGSFFKPHVDTPRSKKMFGSLVVVFPTPHEGGALHLRHRGQEWTFDSATALSTARPSSVGYIAFFSDVEHEVTPVVSGHRVTLTYNLYFDDDSWRELAPAGNLTSEPVTFPAQVETKEQGFRTALSALLENPEFLPDGGMLGFGLQHVYQVEGGRGLDHVYGLLKGSDATVYRAVRALGFEPVLYLYFESKRLEGMYDNDFLEAGLIDRVIQIEAGAVQSSFIEELLNHGGFAIRLEGEWGEPVVHEALHWVTPVTTFNRQSSAYAAYGNNASLGLAYGDVCLIVRLGKAGERLAYPTVAQLKEEWFEKRQHQESFYSRLR